jgi:NhaP-type Na+/H+ or K+/H+ antiporter
MEGESLFNDGVAVVAFVLLVGIPLGVDTFSIPVKSLVSAPLWGLASVWVA